MVGNFLFSLTVRGLGVLLGFLVTYFVAKGLSLDDSGFFFLMIALVTAFSAFSRLGFDYYTVKVLSVFKKNSEYSLITNYVVGVFYRIFASSLFFLFFLFLLFPLFGLDDNYYFIYQIFLIAIIPFSLFSFLGFVFQSVGKVNLFLISQGAGVSFFFLLLLYLISLTGDFSLEKTVYSYVCSCFMLLFFFLSLYFVSYPFTIKSSFRSSKEIFPFWGGQFFSVFISWSVPILIGIYSSQDQVALFSVALRVVLPVAIVLGVCNSYVAPRFSVLFAEDKLLDLEILAKKSVKYMILLSLPVCVVIYLFADYLYVFFGDEYLDAILPLKIILLAQFFNVLTGSVGNLLNMSGYSRCVMFGNLFTVSFISVFSYLLIPEYGAFGGALTYTFAIIFQMTYFTFYVKKYLGFMPMFFFLKELK